MLTDILDALRQMGDILLMAETAVVMVSAILGGLIVFFLMSFVFQVVAYWRVFKKAGQSGWKSLIPVYSSYIRYKIAWKPLWFWISGLLMAAGILLGGRAGQIPALDALAPVITVAGWLLYAASMYKLSRAFGRGFPFALGLILLQPLFTMILGFGASAYQGRGAGTASLEERGG